MRDEKMSRYIVGIAILLVGVYFLLQNLGFQLGLGEIINTYWPIVLIALGLKWSLEGFARFFSGMRKREWITGRLLFGLIILASGIVLQGNYLKWFEMGLEDLWNWIWPILIIYYGISMLFEGNWRRNRNHRYNKKITIRTGKEMKNEMKDLHRKRQLIGEVSFGDHTSWNLEDIHLWHGIGDVYVNLTTAILSEREAFIDLTGLIGDITVLVPRDLPIKVNVDVRIGDVQVFNHKQSGTSRFISYTSEQYDQLTKKVNLMISLSIGDVKVKWVD